MLTYVLQRFIQSIVVLVVVGLVAFSMFSYVGDPVKQKRNTMGYFVLLFLFALIGLSYALKKEFWRDIKQTDKK